MLDVSIRTELLRLMLDLRVERGLTYLFITHDLSLAWVIADRIAVMYLGKIMEIGPAEAVIRSPRNPYTKALVSVSPSPDPPDAGTARQTDDPRGRDAGRGPCADRLSVPSTLPGRVRPLHDRGAAAVRPGRRTIGRVLAGRAGRSVQNHRRRCPHDRTRTRTRGGRRRSGAGPDRRPPGRLGHDGRRRAPRPRRPERLATRNPASGAPTNASATSSRPSGAGSPVASGRSSPAPPNKPADARGVGPAGRSARRGATTSARARSSPPSSTRCATDGLALVRGLRQGDLARAGQPPARSGRCESTSSSASGSITTATTSARCWRSARRGCGRRWATRGGSSSRSSSARRP